MATAIILLSLLPLLSAGCCSWLLIKLAREKAPTHFQLLFSNLMAMNLSQACGYMAFAVHPNIGELFADAYLISAYFFFTHLMISAVQLGNAPPPLRKLAPVYIFPVILTALHLAGFIVDSYRFEQNALMHNDGSLSACLDVYIIASCFFTVAVLRRNTKQPGMERMQTSRNLVALLSFVPLVAAFLIIVVLSSTKYAIPVVVIGPLITIYTALSFYYVSRKKVVDLSIGIRFFMDRVLLAYALLETHKSKQDLKAYSKAVDKQFIKEALHENGNNIQETANFLGINHTTLRNKIKEYELSPQEGNHKPRAQTTQ